MLWNFLAYSRAKQNIYIMAIENVNMIIQTPYF